MFELNKFGDIFLENHYKMPDTAIICLIENKTPIAIVSLLRK